MLKVGDKVLIHPRSEYYHCYEDNPNLTVGSIYTTDGYDLRLVVKWSNGEQNSYNRKDLIKL